MMEEEEAAQPELAQREAETRRAAFAMPYLLTSPEGLEFLAQKEYHCSALDAAAQFAGDPQTIFSELLEDQRHARFLLRIPDLVIREIRDVLDGQGGHQESIQRLRSWYAT